MARTMRMRFMPGFMRSVRFVIARHSFKPVRMLRLSELVSLAWVRLHLDRFTGRVLLRWRIAPYDLR